MARLDAGDVDIYIFDAVIPGSYVVLLLSLLSIYLSISTTSFDVNTEQATYERLLERNLPVYSSYNDPNGNK